MVRGGNERVAKLYFDYIHTGGVYIQKLVTEELTQRTENVRSVLLVEVVSLASFAVLFFFLVWLPYVRQSRIEVPPCRMTLVRCNS